jgi:hypothetical protein
MSIYVVASLSVMAILLFYAGMFGFIWYQYKINRNWLLPIAFFVSLFISIFYFSSLLEPNLKQKNSYFTDLQNQPIEVEKTTSVLQVDFVQHLPSWKYHFAGIKDNAKSVVFGHAERPDRTIYPSAYNYYLDFGYNFGLLAMIPLFWLIFYTLKLIRQFATTNAYYDKGNVFLLFTLSGMVLYLLFVDNSLKVSLRQPYSGIFTFFLWGLLISKLSYSNKKVPHVI